MGGWGSGRRETWWRRSVESCLELDVNLLNRGGCLRAGWRGAWVWDEQSNWIELQSGADRLHLSYRTRFNGGEWEEVNETVSVAWVACRFGGRRPYFICPGVIAGVPCNRTVVKLHSGDPYFLCRHCCGLTYKSQYEDALERARRKLNKALRRLGYPDDLESVPKPKGMWIRTYQRLRRDAYTADIRANLAAMRAFERLRARVKKQLDPL